MTMEFAIAQLGLSETDSHRLRTFLGMASSNGGLKHRWVMAEPATADVVVVSAADEESLAMIPQLGDRKRVIVVVLAGEADEVPSGYLRLPWPIRLENVLSLLRVAEGRAEKEPRTPVTGRTGEPTSDNYIVRFASMLRETGGEAPGAVWRIDGLTRQQLYVSFGERAFYFNDSVAALRNLDINARLEFVPVPKEEINIIRGRKPLIMLRWLIGVQTGSLGLFPWIETAKPMQLRRYPDFQMLYHLPAHRRIATTLSRPRANVETVAELSGQELPRVVEFVNAANLCGYLAHVESRAGAISPASSARRALFKSFRKALGIITANA